jgi:hypothetical protein
MTVVARLSTPLDRLRRRALSNDRLVIYGRAAAVGLTVVLLALATLRLWAVYHNDFGQRFAGGDLGGYLDGVRRWLATGSPYEAYQLEPGWRLQTFSFLHPPIALALFAPFLVLPAPLWWAIPILGTLAVVASLRPARWAWPIMALCLLWPRSTGMLLTGNTDLWVTFFLALGLLVAWPSVLVAIKPSFLPLALVGIRRRSWWVAATVLGAASLLFGSLWFDYARVVAGSPVELTYSLFNLPLVGLPIVAWLGRRRAPPEASASG